MGSMSKEGQSEEQSSEVWNMSHSTFFVYSGVGLQN